MSEHYFYCCVDGNELRVSCEDGEIILAINDPDNDQSKQVRLNANDFFDLYLKLGYMLDTEE